MNLVLFLVRASWRIALLAALIGAVSGAASFGLIALVWRALSPNAPSTLLAGAFAGVCVVVLATRIGSHALLNRLTQNSMAQLRLQICRKILQSPLRHLETVGPASMISVLTGDVSLVSQAMNGIPVVAVNLVVLACGGAFLWWMSPSLLLVCLVFCVLGIGTYWYSARFAHRYIHRWRSTQDVLMKNVRQLIEGVKELKMHHDRRREFVEKVLQPGEISASRSKFAGDCLHDAAITLGRMMFFVAIGFLLFAWPKFRQVDTATLAIFAGTIVFLMSPLEQILGWLPFLAWASGAAWQIEHLGLSLDQKEALPSAVTPIRQWEQIELAGITHAYRRGEQKDGFQLGPIDLTIRPGEILFVIGGNGSGKTTLAKIITGLYTPEQGEIRLDGNPICAENREAYRQLFSAVFDDVVIFESLWGLDAADLDQRAGDYLRQLELDHAVTVTNGVFSTTDLSRGQRKRLALLTAYLEDRPIYVFDEWAADQDPAFRSVFYQRLLPELKQRGKAVVAITHDDRYFASADTVVKLEVGKVVEAAEGGLRIADCGLPK